MSAVENFPLLLSEAEEESSAVAPCFSHEGINVRVIVVESLACLLACLRVPPRLSPVPDMRHQSVAFDCFAWNRACAYYPGFLIVPLYPTQQPLYPCLDQAEYQCDGDPTLPPQARGGLY